MYKMLIVDDQMKEVEGIKGLVDWKSINVEIVGYANNGREGIEKFKELNPDIIITDVVMPAMDGIEMVRRISEINPNVKVMFISCFDDFKFVSKAIEQGTYAYVLKPILTSEFMSAVNKILGICDKESEQSIETMKLRKKVKESRNLLIEQFFKNLFFGIFSNKDSIEMQAKFLEMDISNIEDIRVAYFEITSKNNNNNYYDVISITEKLRENYPQYYFILTDLEHIAVVIINLSNNSKEIDNILYGMVEFIKTNYSVKLCLGVSNEVTDLHRINICFNEAKNAIEYKFYMGEDRVIHTNYITINSSAVEFDFLSINNEIKKIIFLGDKEMILPFINSIFTKKESTDELKYKSFTVINTIYFQVSSIKFDMEKILGKYSQLIEEISQISNYNQLINYLENIINNAMDYISVKNKVVNSDVIVKMKEYIDKNLENGIYFQQVAEYFYFSQGYASYIFKNYTGKTIHQYIEEEKIERAIELLKDYQVKVYEIAERLGYSNSGYFINVFKKKLGCTPVEFQRKNIL